MKAAFTHAIAFVDDMDKAVAFYRDVMGLTLRYQTPGWSEFDTGSVTLALHPASESQPAGGVQLGFGVAGLEGLHARGGEGLTFKGAPWMEHGVLLARALGSEGQDVSISEFN
jgi:lactoylglutathione lyase